MTDCYTDNVILVHVTAEQGVLSAGTATSSNAHFQQVWEYAYRTTEACVTKPVYGVNPQGERIYIETRKFDPNRNYLWAIPLTEIDLSQGVLVQNPGWD